MASISSLTTNKSGERTSGINILDRLVWIRYESHWWPAILYESYSEVQHHLYRYLDTILKAQFAMAIMLEMNSKKQTMVARVLGRSAVELLEIDENDHREFYWKLHKRIQQGCDWSKYDGNINLYRDFHRALDEVQQIFQMYALKHKFELLVPDSGYRTWLEAASARVEELGLSPDNSRDEYDSSSQRKNQTAPTSSTFESNQAVENYTNNREAATKHWSPRNCDHASESPSEIAGGSVTEVRKGRNTKASIAVASASSNLSDLLSVDDSVDTCGKESWPSAMKPTPSSRLTLGRAKASKGNRKTSRVSKAVVFE